jgi:acyl-CoA hydrolase
VFASNAYVSIFTFFSTSNAGNVSAIVPMVSHVDSTEHFVDVIVTEIGLADLRGLSPVERAEAIIENCAHPDYRPLLREYFEKARKEVGGHEPHILEEAFSFHQRLKKQKTMKFI